MPEASEEIVLAIPAAKADAIRELYGDNIWVSAGGRLYETDIVSESIWRFAHTARRSQVENDPRRRHLVVYTLIEQEGRYFSYRRGSSGSEGRLHGAMSIGVGGHVNEEDIIESFPITIQAAINRELTEEIAVKWAGDGSSCPINRFPGRRHGLIISSTSPVDSVHLGVVCSVQFSSRFVVTPRESCLVDPQWLTVDELVARSHELESWSRIVLDHHILQR